MFLVGGYMDSRRLLALRRVEDNHGFGKAGRLRRFNLHHLPGEVLVPAEHMLEKFVEGGFAGKRSLRVGGCASNGLGGRLQRGRGRLLRGGAEAGQGQSGGHQYDSATVHGSFLLSKANVQIQCANLMCKGRRSEERRVGKECRSRWSPY